MSVVELPSRSSATILVKAAPRIGETHGELVCCAGITDSGEWVRLYPVAFKTLEDSQKFSRWDVIVYDWRLPKGDARKESRRVEHKSLKIVASLKKKSRNDFIARHVVTSLIEQEKLQKSLALIRPIDPHFFFEKKSKDVLELEKQRAEHWHNHDNKGLFGFMDKSVVPREPCQYVFKYKYTTADGDREGSCQDWEVEAAFFNWRRTYGETQALEYMTNRFGVEYPKSGFVLAMGTHKAYGNWLINGVVRLDHGSEDSIQELLL